MRRPRGERAACARRARCGLGSGIGQRASQTPMSVCPTKGGTLGGHAVGDLCVGEEEGGGGAWRNVGRPRRTGGRCSRCVSFAELTGRRSWLDADAGALTPAAVVFRISAVCWRCTAEMHEARVQWGVHVQQAHGRGT